ncbi:uncharacterized, partial [Tachysurus ichikawai]
MLQKEEVQRTNASLHTAEESLSGHKDKRVFSSRP